MTSERLHLPPLLNEIAEVAGVVAAVAIADARGGTRAHFPARAPDGHWLVELVGREAADKLCAHFRATAAGGSYLSIPVGPKNFYSRARRRALEMRESHSASAVALDLGVSERIVYKWWADKPDDRQGRLF